MCEQCKILKNSRKKLERVGKRLEYWFLAQMGKGNENEVEP